MMRKTVTNLNVFAYFVSTLIQLVFEPRYDNTAYNGYWLETETKKFKHISSGHTFTVNYCYSKLPN